MTQNFDEAIISLQGVIHAQTGLRTDAHYKEGYGVLFVAEGAELMPRNVITGVSELQLALHGRK